MEKIRPVLDFIYEVMVLTTIQFTTILGLVFFFGLLLYTLARFTRVTFVKSLGQIFDVYFTGLIGTPVHELGHAVFCIVFQHKIVEIKLFSPNSNDGSLGYVNHSYNPHNVWHSIGNFFIGLGPILFGSLVLFLLIKYLVPDNHQLLSIIQTQHSDLSSLSGFLVYLKSLPFAAIDLFKALFTSSHMHSWQFWVFIYLSLCISSHMELSPSDLKGLWSGLLSIIVLFVIVNCITVFFSIDTQKITNIISNYSYMTSGIFVFATFISALFFTSSFVVLNIYTLIRFHRTFHPFA